MPTITLRPSANGYSVAFPSITGGGSVHWVAVSDSSDSSYIRNNTTTPRIDSFILPSTGLTTETITSIDVRARVRSESLASGRFLVGLRLGGTNSVTDFHETIPTSETNYTDLAIPRPGGGSWTPADFASGVEVLVQGNAGSGAGLRVFELYADVNYSATVTPSGQIKVWNGTTWVVKPMKVWNGSTWVIKPLKRWNGSAWVTTPY